jgi:NADH:ubiquinone oxidoreductase subunit 4 (subunit M)
VRAEFARVEDANLWRKLPFVVLLGALIWFGVNPGSLVERIRPAVTDIVKAASAKSPAIAPAPTATAMNTAH